MSLRYRVNEDKLQSRFFVRFSLKLTEEIETISSYNQSNTEGLAQWYEYLDGMVRYLSNPAIAWDYANRYTHYPNGATYLCEIGYDVSFLIKTSKSTNQSFVYVFKADLKPEDFGLKTPATMNEARNTHTDNDIDRHIRRLLREYASRNALITESRGRRIIRMNEHGIVRMISHVLTRLNEEATEDKKKKGKKQKLIPKEFRPKWDEEDWMWLNFHERAIERKIYKKYYETGKLPVGGYWDSEYNQPKTGKPSIARRTRLSDI